MASSVNKWSLEIVIPDNKVHKAVQSLYVKRMFKAEFLIKLLIVTVFTLLRRRNEESDCVKTFDPYSS